MRVLRVFLRLEGIRRFRQELRAVLLADQLAYFGDRVVRDAGRVGTHVGDQTDGTFVAEIDAFVQALGDHHGALHAEAQLARGVLLELAGRERGSSIAAPLALLDRANRPVRAFPVPLRSFSAVFSVGNRRFLVADADEARVKLRAAWHLPGAHQSSNTLP